MMNKNLPQKLLWDSALIKKFWDSIEHTRMKELNFSLLAGDYFLELIQTELCKSKKYLDFGSGSGEIISSLIQKGYQVAAYDISDERVGSLEKFTDTKNSELFLGYISGDDDQLFDTVIMTDVIEHIIPEQLDFTLEHVKSRLNPGGTVIITTPNNEDIGLGICYCPICNHTFHRWQHLLRFSGEDLEELMTAKGFTTKHLHLVDFSYNRIIIEENKILKKQIKELKESGSIFDSNMKESNLKNGDLRIGAETHIVYIGQLQI